MVFEEVVDTLLLIPFKGFEPITGAMTTITESDGERGLADNVEANFRNTTATLNEDCQFQIISISPFTRWSASQWTSKEFIEMDPIFQLRVSLQNYDDVPQRWVRLPFTVKVQPVWIGGRAK
jgi:hypothetical protein